MEESWIQIENTGIENFPIYEISNFGKVRNKRSGHLIKTVLINGYYNTIIRINKKVTTKRIDKLVLSHFDSPQKHKSCLVRHKDDDKLNDNITNLKWINKSGTYIRLEKICKKNNVTCISQHLLSPFSTKKNKWTPIKFRCNTCFNIFKLILPNIISHGIKCSKCKKGDENFSRLELADEISELFNDVCTEHPSRCTSLNKRIKFKCSKGHVYYSTITKLENTPLKDIPCLECKKEKEFKEFVS